MSRRESEKKNDGLGFFSGLLLAGGAAAAGFLAHKMMTDLETQGMSSQPCRPSGSGANYTSWVPGENNTSKRKETRSKVQDKDLPQEVRCVICLVNPREIILVPCGHVCLCEDCAEQIKTLCPICNKRILEKKPAYLP